MKPPKTSLPQAAVTPTANDPSDFKRGISLAEPTQQITRNFQAIEDIGRAYTTYTLRAFKNLVVAEVSEVRLCIVMEKFWSLRLKLLQSKASSNCLD